jgi:hypothetical protein
MIEIALKTGPTLWGNVRPTKPGVWPRTESQQALACPKHVDCIHPGKDFVTSYFLWISNNPVFKPYRKRCPPRGILLMVLGSNFFA